ncbi:MAG: putative LPS assembly protein LptD [Balneolaceae bacterium]
MTGTWMATMFRAAALLLLFGGIGTALQAPQSAFAFQERGTAEADTLNGVPIQTGIQDTVEAGAAADTIDVLQQESSESDTVFTQTPGSAGAERRSIADAVNFQARDSLIFSLQGERKGVLYGSGSVSRDENRLTAGVITLYIDRSEVHAQSEAPGDSLSHPVLQQGERDLRSHRILFNYETERGKFDAAQVQIDEGHLLGNQVKNVSRSEVFIQQGRYSTCPPTHMYYYLQAEQMKVVDEEELFFTNARLFILDIPYPILFPFGYVPAGIDRRQSGLLEPSYVFEQSSRRGIGIQNLGWFQYFNEHLVGQSAFDLYSSGSFFNQSRLQYRKTDRYDGEVTVGYSTERGLEPTDPDYTETVNKRLSLRHNQTLSPYSNLSANINLNTSDYYRRNSFDIDDRSQTSSSSNLSYRYSHPENLYNFNVTTRLNQQFSTNTTRLSGPETNFRMRDFHPFEQSGVGAAEPSWYETISMRYSNNFKSEYEFRPIAGEDATISWFEALFDPSLYREATGNNRHVGYGMRHQGQISASRLIPSQFLNVSANLSVNEYWYPNTIRKEFNEEENRVQTIQERGFEAARDFNSSLNFSTTIYGISQTRIGNLEGFRHTLRPSVSLSYRPDFSEEFWGYYREVPSDTLGNTQRYSIFEQAVYGGPGQGEQQNINFSIGNVLETKHVRRDSTGEVQSRNLRLIDNFNISTSYNMAADSLKFSQVNLTLSSRAIDNLNIRMTANYSLYARNEAGQMIDQFVWQVDNRIAQPLRYQMDISTQYSSSQGGFVDPPTPVYGPYDPFNQGFFSPVDSRFNQRPVDDFNSAWSFGLNFSYSWQYRQGQDPRKSAVLDVRNIRFNLTPKWSIQTRIGYDFIEQDLTPSEFNLSRRMVCWTLSFQFNPFGDFQYYFFRLSIDSGQMQGLFQNLPLLNNLERGSSPSGRNPRSSRF